MKEKFFRAILVAVLVILIILTNAPYTERNKTKVFTLPGLPRPIAKGPVIITSAGQSIDAFIVRDICNQLMIQNFFMPQAKEEDLRDINTIVFAVGYGSFGMKLQGISYEEEKDRITKLLDKAEEKKLTILTVSLDGSQTGDDKTEELLKLIGIRSDYLIGIRNSGSEGVLAEAANEGDIPLTLVIGVNDISGPFASAFR